MPRVTPEHSEARRSQILAAARACFLRNGFHQTSMQDIQREAGLSAGAIYLYFKSKRDIILGIANDILGTVAQVFPTEPVVDGVEVDLAGLLRRFLVQADAINRERNLFPIALLVWGEAIRDPEILVSLRQSVAAIRQRIAHLVEACQARGLVDPEADPAAVTLAIMGLAQGFMIQRTLLDEDVLGNYVAGVEALLRSGSRANLTPEPTETA